MKECNPEQHQIETASALAMVSPAGHVEIYNVHKETIAVAVAEPGQGELMYRVEIANTPKAVERLLARLSKAYGVGLVQFCYEAGLCGYVLYRQILIGC